MSSLGGPRGRSRSEVTPCLRWLLTFATMASEFMMRTGAPQIRRASDCAFLMRAMTRGGAGFEYLPISDLRTDNFRSWTSRVVKSCWCGFCLRIRLDLSALPWDSTPWLAVLPCNFPFCNAGQIYTTQHKSERHHHDTIHCCLRLVPNKPGREEDKQEPGHSAGERTT